MNVSFRPIGDFPKGTLLALLRDAYSFDKRYEAACLGDWQACDELFATHPDIADTCGFVTALDDQPVGFIVWDPRRLPELVEIGHNCIVTRSKGQRLGKAQLKRAVQRISAMGARKIIVQTNQDLVPAQKNYEGAGFALVSQEPCEGALAFSGTHMNYELQVKK